jgi:hypothetical protein
LLQDNKVKEYKQQRLWPLVMHAQQQQQHVKGRRRQQQQQENQL